ncbi:MAG TPA: hypothetical protein VGO67_01935 [Verrucomicrobiae bacterium]|jgi:hypothetical protein
MAVDRKPIRKIVIGAAVCLILLVFYQSARLKAALPKLTIPLADGSRFILEGNGFGRQLYYGGGSWQRFICKITKHQLPGWIPNQPYIVSAAYTNGIALFFRREMTDKSAIQTPWNGSGQLYFLDQSGVEHWVPNHRVGFTTEIRQQGEIVVAEDMNWELPLLPAPTLSLRIRETNQLSGVVSVHDFQIKNPSL